MAKPLCIDLFAGLGGWTKGFLAEGYRCVGFDIERHVYAVTESHFGGLPKTRSTQYPAQLVLQDVLTLHGSQFRNAACIVASPPCQEFSYMAMPWNRAKAISRALRGHGEFPEGYTGSRTVAQLTALFDACFRIQREASEAAGHHIPMVVENVKGAQPWVGKANANYGSFYLWGDVRSIGGRIVAAHRVEFGAASVRAFSRAVMKRGVAHRSNGETNFHGSAERTGQKNYGGSWFNIAHNTESGVGQNPDGRHLTNQRESDGLKNPGMTSWSDYGQPGYKPQGFNVTNAQRYREERGVKQEGSGAAWFDNGICKSSSRSDSRKAASAMIAEIPFDLSRWIARCFRPEELQSKRA